MPQVRSSDVQKNFAEFQTLAARAPVHVSGGEGPPVVILAAAEYERLKRRDKLSLATEDLPDWLVDRIAAAEVDPAHDSDDRS